MSGLLADVVPALRALAVALVGVVLALWWFRGDWELGLALLVATGVLGIVVEALGERLLPKHPVAAVLIMEWWILLPLAIAAVASAALIIIAVELTVPDSAAPVTKEAVGAVASGLSTFLTAAFVSSVGDRDKSAVGDRIKERLQRHYSRDAQPGQKRVHKIDAGSAMEQLLYSDFYQGLSGWDRETRITRAKRIAERLAA